LLSLFLTPTKTSNKPSRRVFPSTLGRKSDLLNLTCLDPVTHHPRCSAGADGDEVLIKKCRVKPTLHVQGVMQKCRLFCSGLIKLSGSLTLVSDQRVLANDSSAAILHQIQNVLKSCIAPVIGIRHFNSLVFSQIAGKGLEF